MIYEYF